MYFTTEKKKKMSFSDIFNEQQMNFPLIQYNTVSSIE